MPKNKGKGGKNRRRGCNKNQGERRELIFKEWGQEYAQVVLVLGNGRVKAQCNDGTLRLCHIRGKMRKKEWVNTGDIVLLGLRDYQDSKADVIMKYFSEEVERLKDLGEIPFLTEAGMSGEDGGIRFADTKDQAPDDHGEASNSSSDSASEDTDPSDDNGDKLFA